MKRIFAAFRTVTALRFVVLLISVLVTPVRANTVVLGEDATLTSCNISWTAEDTCTPSCLDSHSGYTPADGNSSVSGCAANANVVAAENQCACRDAVVGLSFIVSDNPEHPTGPQVATIQIYGSLVISVARR